MHYIQEKQEHEYLGLMDCIADDFEKQVEKIRKEMSKEYVNQFLSLIAESWINDEKIGLDFFEDQEWGWKQYIYINYFIMHKDEYEKEAIEIYKKEIS